MRDLLDHAYRPRRKYKKHTTPGTYTRNPKLYVRNYNMLVAIHQHCHEQQLPFDIDVHYVLNELVVPKTCPILGIPLDDRTACLTTLVPRNGYTKGNVCWISRRAHQLKRDATLEEIEAVARYMREQQ